MGIAEYGALDGLGLAALVQRRQVTAAELLEEAIARAERVNPRINAIVTPLYDRARKEAAAPADPGARPGPFAGVPFLLKDLDAELAGAPMSAGSRYFADYAPTWDATIVTRLRAAGVIIFGKTNAPEVGLTPYTEPELWGPAHNPWSLDRTPGGSSGGAAAAVAAGIVPVAHGNDGGGSVRIPAACCGLVGLKPTRGRISVAPELGDSSLGIDGVLTRTVADTAAVLDVLAGYELGDATWAPPPPEPFAAAASREPGRLRLASTKLPPVPDAPIDPLCAQAVDDAGELLRSLGHEVEEVEPPWQAEELKRTFAAVFCTHVALSIAYSGTIGGH